MKKNRGFTFIELLAVLVILAFIVLATVPAVSGILDRNKQRLYREQVNLIVRSSKDWAAKNLDLLPKKNQDLPLYLDLADLSKGGFIDSDKVYDPRTKQEMHGCVRIQFAKNKYQYEYLEKPCTEYTDSLMPVITVSGGDNQKVEINTTYKLPTVTARSASGTALTVIGPEIKTNGSKVTSITTNKLGQVYTLTYNTTDTATGYKREYTMTLTVVDTKPPVITVLGSTTSQTIQVAKGATFVVPTATVTDNSGQSIKATVSGSVNTSKPGSYDLTYMATDNSKNDTVLIVTVVVK
ncbi:MAG: DUF5011 domain-containing protein [Firmicutes bacterium]|nr:DUF5011 domain-containing protein [Bacillota bacterium]